MSRRNHAELSAAARLAALVLGIAPACQAQSTPTPRPTYQPRGDGGWDYDDDGGPTTGDYVVTFIAITIGLLVVACLFRALGHVILQSAVRARTEAWHAHSPHSPHSLRRASTRGGRSSFRGLDEQFSVSTPPDAEDEDHPDGEPGHDRHRARGQRLNRTSDRPLTRSLHKLCVLTGLCSPRPRRSSTPRRRGSSPRTRPKQQPPRAGPA